MRKDIMVKLAVLAGVTVFMGVFTMAKVQAQDAEFNGTFFGKNLVCGAVKDLTENLGGSGRTHQGDAANPGFRSKDYVRIIAFRD